MKFRFACIDVQDSINSSTTSDTDITQHNTVMYRVNSTIKCPASRDLNFGG